MWDSMYDTHQTFDQQSAEDHNENATIQTEQAASKQVLKEHCGECFCNYIIMILRLF